MPRVIAVIESDDRRGTGNSKDDTVRLVREYHTLDGEFLAAVDHLPSFDELFRLVNDRFDDDQRTRFADKLKAECGKPIL